MSYPNNLVREVSPVKPGRLPVYRQEKELMQLSRLNHWQFRLMGIAPLVEAPVYHKDKWLVPLELDHSPIPPFALARKRAIERSGIAVKQWVVVHEAPKQLSPPPGTPIISPTQYWMGVITKYSGAVAKAVGGVLVLAVAILGPLLLTSLGLMVMASFSLLAGVDPILCAVSDRNVWIEVARWRN